MSTGPLDPGQNWLEAGITGLARQREWDAMVTVDTPGGAGDEAGFVALSDGRLLPDDPSSSVDPAPFAAALEGALDRPYRAVAVRRPELWVVGASSIRVLDLPRDRDGDSLELVRTADGLAIRIDGVPSGASLPELEELGAARFSTYVVRAERLADTLFEVEIEPL